MIKSMTGFGRAEAVTRVEDHSGAEISESQISGSEHQDAQEAESF